MPNITLDKFISDNNLKFTADWVDSRPDGLDKQWDRWSSHWKCRIMAGRRGFNLYFSMGSAHTGSPKFGNVLDCLASDAAGYENARDFEEWAGEYGYDVDSRKAEKIYRTVKRQAEQLKRTLGEDAYNTLLWNTERE